MFGLGIPELLVILAIVLLIFGPKRLKNIGSDLGNAIKGFRTAVAEDESQKTQTEEAKIIEGEAQSQTQTESPNQDSKVQDSKV